MKDRYLDWFILIMAGISLGLLLSAGIDAIKPNLNPVWDKAYARGVNDALSNYSCYYKQNLTFQKKSFDEYKVNDSIKFKGMITSNKNSSFDLTSFNLHSGEVFKIMSNGTFWVKEGSEGITGEQLAKMEIGFNAYLDGYCDRRSKE